MMSRLRAYFLPLAVLVAGLYVPGTAQADLINPLPHNIRRIDQLAALILDALVYLGTIVLILMLVWTGFMFVRAQGAEEKIKEAKSSLLWTVVGGLVLLGATALSLIIQSTIESL